MLGYEKSYAKIILRKFCGYTVYKQAPVNKQSAFLEQVYSAKHSSIVHFRLISQSVFNHESLYSLSPAVQTGFYLINKCKRPLWNCHSVKHSRLLSFWAISQGVCNLGVIYKGVDYPSRDYICVELQGHTCFPYPQVPCHCRIVANTLADDTSIHFQVHIQEPALILINMSKATVE